MAIKCDFTRASPQERASVGNRTLAMTVLRTSSRLCLCLIFIYAVAACHDASVSPQTQDIYLPTSDSLRLRANMEVDYTFVDGPLAVYYVSTDPWGVCYRLYPEPDGFGTPYEHCGNGIPSPVPLTVGSIRIFPAGNPWDPVVIYLTMLSGTIRSDTLDTTFVRPTISLTCDPSPVIRNSAEVTCTATPEPNKGALVVLDWTFTPSDLTIPPITEHVASATWSG
jgi:hypothetical protein